MWGSDPTHQGNRQFFGIFQPTPNYREYLAYAKVIRQVAAVMWPFALSSATSCYVCIKLHQQCV